MASRSNGCFRGPGRGAYGGLPPESMPATFAFHFADVPAETISRLKGSFSLLKKSQNVRQMLISILESADNPYRVALQIVSECEDLFHNKSNTLSSFVIDEFCLWAETRGDKITHLLTPELKTDAFCFITMQKNCSLTKKVIETFKMPQDNMLFVEHIRNFVLAKKYKEAAQCSVALGLVSHFPIDSFILPLVLQDKLPVAEEALATDQKLQRDLVALLDSFLGGRGLRNNIEHLVNKLEVPEVKLERFNNHKPLGKLIAKLAKTFDLPPDSTPNLVQKRSAGALNFIFNKRFFDKSLSLDAWKEMAYESVRNNAELQLDLVTMLNSMQEVEEALYWAVEFSIPQEKWPYNVLMLHQENPFSKCEFPRPKTSNEGETEDWGDSTDFHSLNLPDGAIVMVDSEALLKECIEYISNHESKVVGIDSEWKPAFGGKQNELSLMQLATWDRIFILDIMLMANINPSLWEEAASAVFENPDIIKLGFSLATDMAMIKASIPPFANLKLFGCGYLDLSLVWRRLLNKGLTFRYSGENCSSNGESLSRLVSLCFGRALNKADQFSNWEQRPLRPGQKRYAALDAFVLLEVHKELQHLSEQQSLPFLEVCDEILMGFRSPKKNLIPAGARRGRGRGRGRASSRDCGQGSSQEENIEEQEQTQQDDRSVSSTKFTVDHMLTGLGKQLRKCGIDCTILEGAVKKMPYQDVHTVLQIINDEQRVVLSQGSNVEWFMGHLNPESVYCVQSSSACEQLQEVLENFKIVVREVDVFTRCQVCNSSAFDRVSQVRMLKLAGLCDDSDREIETLLCESLHDSILDFSVESSAAASVDASKQFSQWIMCDDPPSLTEGLTHLGAKIQIKKVPEGILKKVRVFYICSHCGKVYWEGSHFTKALTSFKAVGTIQADGQFSDFSD